MSATSGRRGTDPRPERSLAVFLVGCCCRERRTALSGNAGLGRRGGCLVGWGAVCLGRLGRGIACLSAGSCGGLRWALLGEGLRFLLGGIRRTRKVGLTWAGFGGMGFLVEMMGSAPEAQNSPKRHGCRFKLADPGEPETRRKLRCRSFPRSISHSKNFNGKISLLISLTQCS